MSAPNSRAFARSIAPSLVLVAAALGLVFSAPAIASKPAVDVVNVEVFATYDYEKTASALDAVDRFLVAYPASKRKAPEVGAALAFPISERFGGRVIVAARSISVDYSAIDFVPSGDASGYLVRAGADLFYRDPDAGYFELGYRFRWGDPAAGIFEEEISNGVHAGVGLFIPDQGHGPIDWQASFDWLHQDVEGMGLTGTVQSYSGVGSSGWYLTDSIRFTGGFEWGLEDATFGYSSRDLRGSAELAWLLPFGRVRYVTIAARGNGGKLHSETAAPFVFPDPPVSSVDRTIWSVGGALSFHFPGATSLVQLARERQ